MKEKETHKARLFFMLFYSCFFIFVLNKIYKIKKKRNTKYPLADQSLDLWFHNTQQERGLTPSGGALWGLSIKNVSMQLLL